MQTFGAYLVAVLAASAELAAALPQQKMDIVEPRAHQRQDRFSVPVKQRRSTALHPALAYAKALRKYNATLPSHVQGVVDRFRLPTSSSSKRAGDDQGSVVAESVDSDTEYVATISVGTPAQQLPMDFDTGSSDLWVMGAGVSSASGHKTYDSSASSSAKELSGASWKISYGDGSSSSGNVFTDTVTIGNLTFAQQAVEVATQVSQEFTADTDISGLVGLAMSSINTVTPNAQQTWFDNIKSSLASPLFTADLKHNTAGAYNFGYIDESAHTGEMLYTDLVTSGQYAGFWTFAASGYTVGSGSGTSTGTTPSGTSRPTGTTGGAGGSPTGGSSSSPTGIFGGGGSGSGSGSSSGEGSVPEYGSSSSSSSSSAQDGWAAAEAELESELAGLAQEWGFGNKAKRSVGAPTRTTPAKRSVTRADTAITGIADTGTTLLMLPDAVVTAYYDQVSGASMSQTDGGYTFPCDASLPDFSFNVGEGSITVPGDFINFQPVSTGSDTCYGGIQSDSGIGLAIFGDVALKAALVVFDAGNNRLGWAAKATS